MSQLVGAALPQFILRQDDHQLVWRGLQQEEEKRIMADITMIGNFDSPWWPARGGFVGDMGIDISMLGEWRGFDQPEITSGSNSRFGFVGVTRDVYGSPVGACVVKVFLTATDVLVDQITSDPSGNFILSTPYFPDTHYIVSYKTGAPDVTGSTLNTLVGA